MTSYNPAPGPSRASRITLPPMLMIAPSNHPSPLDYNHDLSQSPYLRYSYVGPTEHDFSYEFAGSIDYHPADAFPLRHGPSHSPEIESGHNTTDSSPSLSLSLLLAAANAAQADTNSYVHYPIHYPTSLSLGCQMDPSGTYSPAVTSPEPPTNWSTVGLATSDSDRLVTRPTLKRMGKRKRVAPQSSEKDSQVKDESVDEDFSKTEKPKQGRKKRSVGYVRPIIIHRKRVGQRLLDMLRTAPIPSSGASMELSRARCFPFADMKHKLKLWYGLQIEWPTDASFRVEELRSTRRMRLDELERLDKTLDGGFVRLRLSDDMLALEPHRANEFSLPSDGNTGEDNSYDNSDDQDELDSEETHYRPRKRRN